MKTIFTLLLLCFTLSTVSAQGYDNVKDDRAAGTTTQKGQKILPQTGDFAIGIDATPFLKYLGNSFNGNTDNDNTDFFSFKDNIFNAPSIYGKYFLSDNTAIRVKMHIGFTSYTDEDIITDITDYEKTVTDKTTFKSNGFGIRIGHEWRRGYGRLQGFFGPEVGLGIFSDSKTYKYGNPMKKGDVIYEYDRDLKYNTGTCFTGLLGGFAGVEYFIAPKIAVGGEMSLAFCWANQGKGSYEYEYINDKNQIIKDKKERGGNSLSNFSTSYTGSVYVTFHF